MGDLMTLFLGLNPSKITLMILSTLGPPLGVLLIELVELNSLWTVTTISWLLMIMDRSQRTLHGGSKGFSDVLWTVKRHIEDSHITFTDDSRDGEEGSPGHQLRMDTSSHEHLRKATVLHDSVLGRKLELWTNQPGLPFYTSNMLDDVKGKGGFMYKKYAVVCLKTQHFPDSVNHPNFPSQILDPGDTYMHSMVYRFTAN
ncbi:hypothetical protein ACLB2K_038950 [Fragaria x ananassa]